MYKRGQLYVADYNEVFKLLRPAPELHIPMKSDDPYLYVPLPTKFGTKPADLVSMRKATFRRQTLMLLGHPIPVLECIDAGDN